MKNSICLIIMSIMILCFDIQFLTLVTTDSSNNIIEEAFVIKIEGYTSLIDTPVQEYVTNALNIAKNRNKPLIIYIDTYGGYLDSALTISKVLLEVEVPVIVFVRDKAYSAGALISIAAHILVMRPTAVIGAAQPISINPVTGEIIFINESKILNPILKNMELCAEARKRNTTIIKRFVYENLVLSGKEALQYKVIDYVADSIEELLSHLQGIEVNISGVIWRLYINRYEELPPSLDIYVKIFLRNSLVNSLLLFIGIFGTLGLLYTGRIDLLPITIIALMLALFGSDIEAKAVPAILIALGSILLSIELFVTPGFGVLGVSGIIAIIIGLLLTPLPSTLYTVGIVTLWRIITVFAIGFGTLFVFILYKAILVIKKPRNIRYVPEGKVVGKAIDRLEPGLKGYVLIDGELWEAESNEVIEVGEEVELIERKGFIVRVKKRPRNT
ncbi:MAG: NfeD family protein [Ignisphaera sp.]|uniref:Nodulation protein NfeD n=2 Tax=Ignisphaera aggregans TaxID=334771 RepID=A0A832AKU7_9CREN